MVDSGQGKAASLADVPEFNLLAGALSAEGVHSAFLSDQTPGPNSLKKDAPMVQGGLLHEDATPPKNLLRPYSAYAAGTGSTSDGTYLVLALAHDTPEAASANVALFKDNVAAAVATPVELAPYLVDKMDVRAEGRLLVAKVYAKGPMWLRWFYGPRPVLTHQ